MSIDLLDLKKTPLGKCLMKCVIQTTNIRNKLEECSTFGRNVSDKTNKHRRFWNLF